ncbi:SIR2-like domain-containing protein [Tranquillimonas rosea]|uniref:SIR2-like domain-containing protein n=1 Tax=Tranquillimonas rosea TaxID=641238 RepID=A0A1H9PIG5_9RHOB|nr:SIR2 family protein [Tranquillimonas rosea]SER48086.1 SIR2-like domain-containing protein [Tranquillimonas rosea]
MEDNSTVEFQKRLNMARNGGAVLFCGAGFSADCLNFKPDETLGTGAQLLDLFNSELRQEPPYKDLRNAADALQEQIADNGMMKLLKDRFAVSNVTADMTDLLSYPWQAAYTTNYDDALELAAKAAHKPVEALNNTDDPETATPNLPIIHLHGYVQKWDIHNIQDSCVLGADSYSRLTYVNKWLDRFRRDIDQAQIVVFVGFNAGDFHLNQAINDLTGLREKAFFINRPTAEADPDVTAAQKKLGTPFFNGRAGLADTIRRLLAEDAPKEPRLASFTKYTPEEPSAAVPTQVQIEDLFLYGKVDHSQLARDASNDISEYHIQRGAIQGTLAAIAGDTRIILLEGYPCDGKTLLTTDLAYRLSGARPVYRMRQAYENVLNEVADILHHAPNAVLIIENCFDLQADRLASIARQFDAQEGILILTSRSVAVDASPVGLASLERFGSFRKMPLVRLDEHEASTLSDLADQIAGWRDFRALDAGARLRFIQSSCQASLPHFLMRLLRSDYVTDRYREEFNKISLSRTERAAIITALYVSHIGENAPVSFLSNAMETDYGSIIDGLNARIGTDTFRIVRRTGDMIQTVPSIGAQNILQNLFSDAEVVDVISPILKSLAAIYRTPFEQRMFTQLMRFSILSDLVTNSNEIDRFFEQNKQAPQIRRMPLFWMQWHMAKCAAGEILVAEKLLDQGYREANEFEYRTGITFDRRQLDDRRAKFLMLRGEKTNRAGVDLFRDFKTAIELTAKTLRQDNPQYYPFETLADVVRSFGVLGYRMDEGHIEVIQKWLDELTTYARKRVGVVPLGYQRDKAQSALDKVG